MTSETYCVYNIIQELFCHDCVFSVSLQYEGRKEGIVVSQGVVIESFVSLRLLTF
jgi:hypothetical protein